MADDDELQIGKQDTAALTDALRQDLNELNWTPAALVDRMKSLGDYRPRATILRCINRALEGQNKPSGELLALARLAVRFKRRLLLSYENLVWTELVDGSHTVAAEDFRITLVPQSKGRWLVVVVHKNGYCAPYPRWQNTLKDAKHMAFVTLDNAQHWLNECAEEQAHEA